MKTITHRSLCASSALVAALALVSTAAAQDASPVADPAPSPTVNSAPAPEIVVPDRAIDVAAQPVVAPIAVDPVPVVSPSAEPARNISSSAAPAARVTPPAGRTRALPARQPAPGAAAGNDTPAPAAVAPLDSSVGPPAEPVATAPTVTLPLPPAEPTAQASSSDSDLSGAELAALGLVGFAGIGGLGLVLASRARRRRKLAEPVATPEQTTMVAKKPVVSEVIDDSPTVPEKWTAPATASASPEHFAMPSGPVPTGTERNALLSRMVAAPPDDANPFTSRKARRRRAKIILARRERGLKRDAETPFDWRSYKPSGMRVKNAAEQPVETNEV